MGEWLCIWGLWTLAKSGQQQLFFIPLWIMITFFIAYISNSYFKHNHDVWNSFFCACAVADAAIAALCIILYSHSQHEGGEEREWGKIKKCALGHCQGRERAEKKSQNIYKKMWTGVNRFLRWMFELKKGRFFVMMMMKADDGDEKLFSSHFASLRIFFCCIYWMILRLHVMCGWVLMNF